MQQVRRVVVPKPNPRPDLVKVGGEVGEPRGLMMQGGGRLLVDSARAGGNWQAKVLERGQRHTTADEDDGTEWEGFVGRLTGVVQEQARYERAALRETAKCVIGPLFGQVVQEAPVRSPNMRYRLLGIPDVGRTVVEYRDAGRRGSRKGAVDEFKRVVGSKLRAKGGCFSR